MAMSAAISPLAPAWACSPVPFSAISERDYLSAVYFGMKSGFIAKDKARDELIAGTERGG
jgi:hypothetical protein